MGQYSRYGMQNMLYWGDYAHSNYVKNSESEAKYIVNFILLAFFLGLALLFIGGHGFCSLAGRLLYYFHLGRTFHCSPH